MKCKTYKIVKTARSLRHIQKVYDYSRLNWGRDAALKYIRTLESGIVAVSKGREHPCINPKISDKYPYILVKNHNIFLEFSGDVLIVVAVLHTAMNANERLQRNEN